MAGVQHEDRLGRARARAVPFRSVALGLAASGLLLVTAPLAVHAQGMQFDRLEFVTQSVKTSGQSFATGWGMHAHLSGGDLNPGFDFVPAIENWEKLDKLPRLGVPEVRQRDWRIGGDLRYRIGHGSGWAPYAGAGLSLDITKQYSQVAVPGQPVVISNDSGRKLSPSFVGGVDLPGSSRLKNAFELSYHLVPGLKQFKINYCIGYRFGKLPESSP
jgi:hypothetical protein